MHAIIHPTICPYTHPPHIHPSTLCTHPPNQSPTTTIHSHHSPTHPFNHHPFIHASTNPSTHPSTQLSTPSIYSSIYPHSHPLLLLLLLFLLLFLLLLLLLVLVFLFLLLLFHVLLSPSSYLHFRSIQLHSALAPTIPPRNSPFTNPSVHQPHRPTMDESEATVSRQLPTTGIHYL